MNWLRTISNLFLLVIHLLSSFCTCQQYAYDDDLVTSGIQDWPECKDVQIRPIKSLLSLERSILCDEYNIQSLTESFFPANNRQAFTVQIHFYVNTSLHPLQQLAEDNGNITLRPTYVFIWFSSSVLAFIEPRLLEGISFFTFSAEIHHAHVRIAPFLRNDERWIRGLLNNATVWMKSYAERRYIAITEGVNVESMGFSAYKPNIDADDYVIENSPMFYSSYVVLLIMSFALVLILTGFAIPLVINKKYDTIYRFSMIDSSFQENLRFKFHNLLWGIMLTLGCVVLAVFVYSIRHFITFGFKWTSRYPYIYPMLVVGLAIAVGYSLALSVIVVQAATRNGRFIKIPRLLYFISFVDPKKSPSAKASSLSTSQKTLVILWLIYGVFVSIASTLILAFSLIGVLLALFVDPVRVITTIALYLSAFFCLIYAFGSMFEVTDRIGLNEKQLSKFVVTVKVLFVISFFTMLTLFVLTFGFTYVTIVFYVSNADQLSLFSSIGELLPVILASVAAWLLRFEFKSYFAAFEKDTGIGQNNRLLDDVEHVMPHETADTGV